MTELLQQEMERCLAHCQKRAFALAAIEWPDDYDLAAMERRANNELSRFHSPSANDVLALIAFIRKAKEVL